MHRFTGDVMKVQQNEALKKKKKCIIDLKERIRSCLFYIVYIEGLLKNFKKQNKTRSYEFNITSGGSTYGNANSYFV